MRAAVAAAILVTVAALGCGSAAAARPDLVLASRNSEGAEGNRSSSAPSLSATGRVVAFGSNASNLVPGDHNHVTDVFVRDLDGTRTRRVSVSSGGKEGNRGSDLPSISANGDLIAFQSLASNLVSGDTNHAFDIFVHDLSDGTTRCISLRSTGGEANGASVAPSISADGSSVAFASDASNLVPRDKNGGGPGGSDVYVHSLRTGKTRLVSVSSKGRQGNGDSYAPAFSADGRFVAFQSQASNLVSHHLGHGYEIFVHDLQTGRTRLVSKRSNGTPIRGVAPSISANGRYVAFNRFPTVGGRPAQVFVRDTKTNRTRVASARPGGARASAGAEKASISDDGRYVAFESSASNLGSPVSGRTTNVFLRDLRSGHMRLLSVGRRHRSANGSSGEASVSSDGRTIAFTSQASNLVRRDRNQVADIFVVHPR